MNRVAPPTFFDDHAALRALANNRRVRSYPFLADYVDAISEGYAGYAAANGNAHAIENVELSDDVAEFLRSHYKSPPSTISHIGEIRRRSGIRTCPMCGALRAGTLDHLLPKEDFPEFAIFGRNLVPGCSCNTLRGRILLGGPNERILHPYYDDVLSERLIAARIEDVGPVPQISLRTLLDKSHADYASVAFHIDKLVQRTLLVDYLGAEWIKLVQRPKSLTTHFRRDPPDRVTLVDILEAELDRSDDHHESLNNWDSIFLKGLLDDHVIDWLFERFSRPGRSPGSPLIARGLTGGSEA
jgi:hypothetical protein